MCMLLFRFLSLISLPLEAVTGTVASPASPAKASEKDWFWGCLLLTWHLVKVPQQKRREWGLHCTWLLFLFKRSFCRWSFSISICFTVQFSSVQVNFLIVAPCALSRSGLPCLSDLYKQTQSYIEVPSPSFHALFFFPSLHSLPTFCRYSHPVNSLKTTCPV